MSQLQLIETLRMEDGQIERLSYHEARYENAMSHFFPDGSRRRLIDILRRHGLSVHNPTLDYPGTWKIHVDYDAGTDAVEVTPYHPKPVSSLQLVIDDDIDYSYKYADRHELYRCLEKRRDCDDVIIVKDGLLTDTSYSNIALFDGSSWFTPRTPLLKGTMRAYLLDKRIIKTADIRPTDLASFKKVCLINAMLSLDQLTVPINNIKGCLMD